MDLPTNYNPVTDTPKCEVHDQLPESIVRRFFIDFGEMLSKMIVFLLESPFLVLKPFRNAMRGLSFQKCPQIANEFFLV